MEQPSRRAHPGVSGEQLWDLQHKFQTLEGMIRELQLKVERNSYVTEVLKHAAEEVKKLASDCHDAIHVRMNGDPSVRHQLWQLKQGEQRVEGRYAEIQQTYSAYQTAIDRAVTAERDRAERAAQIERDRVEKKFSDFQAARESGKAQISVAKITAIQMLLSVLITLLLSWFLRVKPVPPPFPPAGGPPPPPTHQHPAQSRPSPVFDVP